MDKYAGGEGRQGPQVMRKAKIISLLVGVLFLLACSETFTEHYATYEEAQIKGAVKRGWIPAMVPTSATDIYEQHNIDTNNVWVRFTLPSQDWTRLTNGLRKLENNEVEKIKIRYPSRVNWWFEGVIQQSPANDAALYAEFYSMKCQNNKDGYFAIDRGSLKVYYWCTP